MATKRRGKKREQKKGKSAGKAKAAKRIQVKKTLKTVKPSKPATRKIVAAKSSAANKTRAKAASRRTPPRRTRGKAERIGNVAYDDSRLRAQTGGQAGDTQGLSGVADAESESVKELLEEGQSFEAEVVQGVESVPDADEGEVRTHEVPEDDVPDEYLGKEGQN